MWLDQSCLSHSAWQLAFLSGTVRATGNRQTILVTAGISVVGGLVVLACRPRHRQTLAPGALPRRLSLWATPFEAGVDTEVEQGALLAS